MPNPPNTNSSHGEGSQLITVLRQRGSIVAFPTVQYVSVDLMTCELGNGTFVGPTERARNALLACDAARTNFRPQSSFPLVGFRTIPWHDNAARRGFGMA